MKLSRASIALLLIQLAIVSSIAGKYLYQRWTCPRVWTRAVAYDPELVIRGRYLSIQLTIDACSVGLPPIEKPAEGETTLEVTFHSGSDYLSGLKGEIGVQGGKLVIRRLVGDGELNLGQSFAILRNQTCSSALLRSPVDFYISETAASPFPLAKGSELWVEVTVPPKGPPRPIAMATKDSEGHWQPLNYR